MGATAPSTMPNSSPNQPTWPERLLSWYRAGHRSLPWRGQPTAYQVWISEIMLQQTQVATVAPRFRRFLERFPDVQALAAAEREEVLREWQGLGYYSRARHLHQAAGRLVRERGGALPCTGAEWRAVEGVGPYTAAAIASIAFGEPLPVVDGNVVRVAARLWRLPGEPTRAAFRRQIAERLEPLIAAVHPGDFNQAMMELGATVCRPRRPACAACPLAADCAAHRHGQVEQFPQRRPRLLPPHYEVAVAILVAGERFLVARRPERQMLGGMWELPGGKLLAGETPVAAVARECQEELGVAVRPKLALPTVRHAYSHFSVTLHPFVCELCQAGDQPVAEVAAELRWITPAEIAGLPFPRGTLKVFELPAFSQVWLFA